MTKKMQAGAITKPHDEREENDAYFTPLFLAQAICRTLGSLIDIPVETILEPSAGAGVFMACAQEVWPTADVVGIDINPQGPRIHKLDFMRERQTNWDLEIGNPPYICAEQHVRHGLHLLRTGGFLAFLMPTTFLAGDKRAKLYEEHPLRYLQPVAGRPSFLAHEGNGAQEFAVFTWKKGWQQNGELLPPLKWKPAAERKSRRRSSPPTEALEE